jgi:hypothetical protein
MKPRIVACCSTVPERAGNGRLEEAVRSILAQTVTPDVVYVHYPMKSKRMGCDYPEPSAQLLAMDRVVVLRTPDHGPLTKVYPVTRSVAANDEDVAIVLFDDDCKYPPDWLQPLIELYEKYERKAGVGYTGSLCYTRILRYCRYNMTKKPLQNAVMQTSNLVVYPRCCFPDDPGACLRSMQALPSAAYMNDDMVIGMWAHQRKVRLFTLNITKERLQVWNALNSGPKDGSSLVVQQGHNQRQIKLYLYLASTGKLRPPFLLLATITAILGVLGCVILVLGGRRRQMATCNENSKFILSGQSGQ